MVSLKLVTGLIAAAAVVVSAAPLGQRSLVTGQHFDHFMVVVLENEDYSVRISVNRTASLL
jgi:hypothetical protein